MLLQPTLDAAAELHRQGKLAAAKTLYQQVLHESPDHPVALHLMGVLASQEGDHASAVTWIQRAIQLRPEALDFHLNLTLILQSAGRFSEAAESCRQALRLAPGRADLHFRHGNLLRLMGLMTPAVFEFQEVLRLEPQHIGALNNLSVAMAHLGRLDEALDLCRRAIASAPKSALAYGNLGSLLKQTGEIAAATATFRQAMDLDPTNPRFASSLLSAMNFDPAVSASNLREELERWNQHHAMPLAAEVASHANNPDPIRGLRVGYVSPDFTGHVIGRNLLPLFRHLDSAAFEIVCYSSVQNPDAFTRHFERLASHFHSVASETDAQLAQRIRADQIDILVDLTLHLEGCRLGVFARKPAPVQVTFAGYPGSTGVSAIDFRLTDPHLDPPEQDDAIYVERTLRLPTSFWCYDPGDATPSVNDLPAHTAGYITFGSLNNFSKVNEEMLRLWSHILAAVPGSRLMLLSDEGRHRQRTGAFLASLGIGIERLGFFPRASRSEYLQFYHQLDLTLDTVPYNGHTTSLDSLYMGVPVISLVGDTVVGRAGLSQLTNLGLPEYVARSPEQYVKIAVDLANDLPRLQALRASLRQQMERSPLMDAPRFARDVETLYRTMWRQWCASHHGGATG